MAAGRAHPTTQLYQLYAEPFDLPTMKLLILHVSEHRDENIVRPIWNKTFEDSQFCLSSHYIFSKFEAFLGLDPDGDAQTNADRIIAKFIPLGQRFYPSESAFPLRK